MLYLHIQLKYHYTFSMTSLEEALSCWFSRNYPPLDTLLDELLPKLENRPVEHLTALTLRIFNNFRKGDFKQVASDFNVIGSPEDSKWMYEAYPNKYKLNLRGSMACFGLKVIYAYFPHLIGSTYTAIDRLKSLLRVCIEQRKLERDKCVEVKLLFIGVLLSECLNQCNRPEDSIRVLNSIIDQVPKPWVEHIKVKISHAYISLGFYKLEKSHVPYDYNKDICMILLGKHDDTLEFVKNSQKDALNTFLHHNLKIFQLIFDVNNLTNLSQFDHHFIKL